MYSQLFAADSYASARPKKINNHLLILTYHKHCTKVIIRSSNEKILALYLVAFCRCQRLYYFELIIFILKKLFGKKLRWK